MAGRLSKFRARGFKSLHDVEVELAPFTVLFGPNAVGKSNLLEAMALLAGIAAERTFAEAVDEGLRGQVTELFELPPGGLPELLSQPSAELALEADFANVEMPGVRGGKAVGLRYRVGVRATPRTGELALAEERLVLLGQNGQETKENPRVETVGDRVVVRHRGTSGRGREVMLGSPFAVVADRQVGGAMFPELEAVREQLRGWEFLYLEPRHAMRAPQGPRHARGTGAAGEWIAPFLMGLHERRRPAFDEVRRLLQRIVPSIEALQVGLDETRGLVDVTVVQDGTPYSLRVLSEGTLRILALACVVANPDRGRLLAFEEPENGVHPARLRVIEELLQRLSLRQQVVVTTHSPDFAAAAARRQLSEPGSVALFRVVRRGRRTRVEPFDVSGDLLADRELRDALRDPEEAGALRELIRAGWLDA